MTKKYELLYVLNGTLPADELKAQMSRVQTIVEASAEIVDIVEWGRRRLAYEIQDLREGYYVIVHFNADADAPKEIERLLRISDSVLRYLITVAEGSFMPIARRSVDDEIAHAEEVEAIPTEAEMAPEESVDTVIEDAEPVAEEALTEEVEKTPETPERTE